VTIVYHLCGYDKSTERLVEEHLVPARLLTTIRTLIEPVPDDRDLILPYELTTEAVRTLAKILHLTIDPAEYHYYFEASDASDTGIGREVATAAVR
jgi:hypothetical protein